MLKTKSLLIAGVGVVCTLTAQGPYNLCSGDIEKSAIYQAFTGSDTQPNQAAGWLGLFSADGTGSSTGIAGCNPGVQGKQSPLSGIAADATFNDLGICAQAQIINGTALGNGFYLDGNTPQTPPKWILTDGTKLPDGATYTKGMNLTSARTDAAQQCAQKFQNYCTTTQNGQPTLQEATQASNALYYPGSGAILQSYCEQ